VSGSPRVLVAGAGSIGRRHCANLRAAGATVTVLDPDAERVRATVAGVDSIAGTVGDAIPDGYDGVVVASPTVMHAAQTAAAVASGAHVLVEKPLACCVADVPDAVVDERVCVGYNLRFVAPLVRLVGAVHGGDIGTILSVRVWFGSWLPGWRAGDYRVTYSAQRGLGGGVLLDAIHELDEIVWLFGDGGFEVAGALVQQLGDLEIDVEDSVHALLVHHTGAPVEIALDYLSRAYRRGIEVVGSDATMRYDWARGQLEREGPGGGTTEPVAPGVDDAYVAEARAFLAWIAGGPALPVGAADALASLRLADQIRAFAP
jgi:predicted dehydrogenase